MGIDHDKSSIEAARVNLADTPARFACDDIFHYLRQNPEETFDTIVLSHVLEHIENPEEFLLSLNQLAKFFYIEVPDFQANYLNYTRLQVETDLVYTDADHVREFDRKELC